MPTHICGSWGCSSECVSSSHLAVVAARLDAIMHLFHPSTDPKGPVAVQT